MTNKEEKEIDLISKIISVIVTWAKLNGYEPNDTLKVISGWLGTIDSIVNFEDFKPNWSSVIRALDDAVVFVYLLCHIFF